jgi:D-alanyl-D-alanine carboxypeptidase (penicillin-binding protein 5/6)
LLLIVVVAGGYVDRAVRRALPLLQPTHRSVQLQTRTPALRLAWPREPSAVGIVGGSIILTHGARAPTAIASTAKLITALSVLHEKPLAAGQQGPTITLGAADVALYNTYKAEAGSVVAVKAGEHISEYQMLETMLLPSAKNMADSLATWAFGSLNAYAGFAKAYVTQLGLTHTHVGSDASGFDPNTTSTASDLVKLGEAAMQNPVLARIVGQSTARDIPVAGAVKNLNSLLGTAGIVGVKTGNTNQAGGVFISAAKVSVNARPVTIVTAVLDAPTLLDALRNSLPLVQSAEASFQPLSIIIADTVVGHYRQPWGGTIAAIASRNLTIDEWDGSVIPSTLALQPILANARAGQTVGSLSTTATSLADRYSVGVTLKTPPSKPSLWWRLLHP